VASTAVLYHLVGILWRSASSATIGGAADIARLGYIAEEIDGGERILAAGIVERFSRNKDGTLALIIAGSTTPVAETRHHAGIVATRRFSFDIP